MQCSGPGGIDRRDGGLTSREQRCQGGSTDAIVAGSGIIGTWLQAPQGHTRLSSNTRTTEIPVRVRRVDNILSTFVSPPLTYLRSFPFSSPSRLFRLSPSTRPTSILAVPIQITLSAWV